MNTQDLPREWELLRLGEVCEVNPRRPRLSRDDDAPTSFLPMASVDEILGVIADLQVKSYSKVRRGYTYFEEKDVLFAKITPSMQNGKSAIARGLIDGLGFGSTEFHVLRPSRRVIPEWIHLFVRQKGFRDEAVQHFRGAVGQRRVPEEFLAGYTLPVPPLDEQRRIVARIEELFDRIEEAQRLRVAAEEDTERLMPAALVEILDVTKSEYKCQTIGNLIEAGVLQIIGGGTPSKKHAAFWSGTILWVSPKDMKRWIIDDTEDHITSQAVASSSAKLIPERAVLVVVRGMILARMWPVAIAGTELTINQDMKALCPSSGLIPEYLGYALRGSEPEVLNRVETAAHGTKRLKTKTLEAVDIPIPPASEQHRIVDHLDGVQAQVAELRRLQAASAIELERLSGAVLAQAFRGEL